MKSVFTGLLIASCLCVPPAKAVRDTSHARAIRLAEAAITAAKTAKSRSCERFKDLVRAGADVRYVQVHDVTQSNDKYPYGGRVDLTLLHVAADNCDPDALSLVIARKPDVDAVAMIDADTGKGWSALDMADEDGVPVLLAAHAKVGPETLLAHASRQAPREESQATLKALIDHGGDVDGGEPRIGLTALLYAVAEGRVRLVEFLILEHADVNKGFLRGGASPLQTAKRSGRRKHHPEFEQDYLKIEATLKAAGAT
jgi:ankyrin repeat protein